MVYGEFAAKHFPKQRAHMYHFVLKVVLKFVQTFSVQVPILVWLNADYQLVSKHLGGPENVIFQDFKYSHYWQITITKTEINYWANHLHSNDSVTDADRKYHRIPLECNL